MTFERSIQLLACLFDISTDAEPLIHWLDSVRPSAIQDYPITHRHRLEVYRAGSGYGICEDGTLRMVLTIDEAMSVVEQRLHDLAFAALAHRTKLHAGCGTWGGRRLLVVGPKGAGKTTLMTRLLFEGCAVEGDEMVLVADGQVVAYPRRFGIRLRTLKLVPQVGTLVPDLLEHPDVDVIGGYHRLAFDPAQLGIAWRIAEGPVDAIFFLSPRHGGRSRLVPCSPQLMAQHVMTQSAPPHQGSGAWVRDVGALVRHAAVYEIAVGDLDSAVTVVRQCLSNLSELRGGASQ
jgi:hypothetical protein